MPQIPYGYALTHDGNIVVDEHQALIVKEIYAQYLAGNSSGTIASMLMSQQVLSPSNNEKWNRIAIDNILSNRKYLFKIISEEQFFEVQFEKERRSNINQDNGRRKTTRYNSQNVLSGLLICAECGANYRRITRGSGEIVWRCGNRVEYGSKICKSAPTISDSSLKEQLCNILHISDFDSETILSTFDTVVIDNNLQLIPCYKENFTMNLPTSMI